MHEDTFKWNGLLFGGMGFRSVVGFEESGKTVNARELDENDLIFECV
jgi:hypothetical protein